MRKGFYTTRWSHESTKRLLVKVWPEGAWKVGKWSQKRQSCWFLDQVWEGAELTLVLRGLCRRAKWFGASVTKQRDAQRDARVISLCQLLPAPSAHSPGSGKSRTQPPAGTSPPCAARAALPAARKTRGSSSHQGPGGTQWWTWSTPSSKIPQNTPRAGDRLGGQQDKVTATSLQRCPGFPADTLRIFHLREYLL